MTRLLTPDSSVALAQEYTTVPVEIITVNGTTSFLDQIRIFNSFDVLITPHGSHLANGLFTMKPNSKVRSVLLVAKHFCFVFLNY